MSDRVIIDRVILGEWIERAFRAGRCIDRVEQRYEEDTIDARAFWIQNRDQIQRDLEDHSLVLPYENRRANHGD